MINCVMHMKLIFTIIIIKQSNRDILNCLYYIYIYYRDRHITLRSLRLIEGHRHCSINIPSKHLKCQSTTLLFFCSVCCNRCTSTNWLPLLRYLAKLHVAWWKKTEFIQVCVYICHLKATTFVNQFIKLYFTLGLLA